MKKNGSWDFNKPRTLQLKSEEYGEAGPAAIREMVQNAIDAGSKVISIKYRKKKLSFRDYGESINPQDFVDIWRMVNTDWKLQNKKHSLGYLGQGRLSYYGIAKNEKVFIHLYWKGEKFSWGTSLKGIDFISKIQTGEREGFEIELNTQEELNLEEILTEYFAVPLKEKKVYFNLNGTILKSVIPQNAQKQKIKWDKGRKSAEVYFWPIQLGAEGSRWISHRGILVYKKVLTGLSVYVNEACLRLTPTRDGYYDYAKQTGPMGKSLKKLIRKYRISFMPTEVFQDIFRKLLKWGGLDPQKSKKTGKGISKNHLDNLKKIRFCDTVDLGLKAPAMYWTNPDLRIIINRSHPLTEKLIQWGGSRVKRLSVQETSFWIGRIISCKLYHKEGLDPVKFKKLWKKVDINLAKASPPTR